MQVIKKYSGIKVTVNEEDLNKKGVIYLLEFPNGKVYIGQTRGQFNVRLSCHCSAAKCVVQYALQKYKEVKAYVLSSGCTDEQLNTYEQVFIKGYQSMDRDKGYNMDSGGNVKRPSIETIEKQRLAHKGYKTSEETKKKLSDVSKGVHKSKEHAQKIKEARQIKVISIPDNIVFDSITIAGVHYGITQAHMTRYLDNDKVHGPSGQTFKKVS